MSINRFEEFINIYSFNLETGDFKEFLRVNLYEIFWKCHFPIVSIGYAAKDLCYYLKSDEEIRSFAVITRISLSLVGLGPLLFIVDVIGTLFKIIYGSGESLRANNLFSKVKKKAPQQS